MNAIKKVKALLLILILSAITGCNESLDPISAGEKPQSEDSQLVQLDKSRINVLPVLQNYNTEVKLGPFESAEFSESVTGLSTIKSSEISIKSSSPGIVNSCDEVYIYGSKNDVGLSCFSKNLNEKLIGIQNMTDSYIHVGVSLLGIPSKKIIGK